MKMTFPTVLFVVFLVLKLTGYIAWSWWWVTAPLWCGLLLGALVFFGALFYFAVLETPEAKAARLCRELANRLSRK